jgi:hypothetical protein
MAAGYHDLRLELEPLGGGTRLTLWHDIDRESKEEAHGIHLAKAGLCGRRRHPQNHPNWWAWPCWSSPWFPRGASST